MGVMQIRYCESFAFTFVFKMTSSRQTSPPLPDHASLSQPRRIDSQELLQGKPVVEIDHAGQRYQLRVTRENKLILTK